MTLTTKAQQSLDFAKSCMLQGLCTPKEYLKAVKEIYQEDVNKQIEFLMEQGFTRNGAFRNVYNLDRKESII